MSPPRRSDRALLLILRSLAALSAGLVLLVVVYLVAESVPALRALGLSRFVTDERWSPTGGFESGQFDLVPMLVASLAATVGAVLLAAPLGVLVAAFCQFYAPPVLQRWTRRLIELLAGIPSVVYGFWGLATLRPILMELRPPGDSLLAGILVLTIMIVPTIALLAEAAFRNVPAAHLRGAAALSLSRWSTLLKVVLPATRGGLAIAIILGTTRAVGETMAVLMVCGNVVAVPTSLLDPVRTLTANIALELGYATSEHRAVLFVTGLLLMALVVGLVALAERLKKEGARV